MPFRFRWSARSTRIWTTRLTRTIRCSSQADSRPRNSGQKIAEDFRVFRVNLINRKPEDKKDGSVIAVTSAQAKEGKTFCTANLGAALAEAGYKVLLIDCDTGKRGLQSYFGTADEKGLMNILSDETDFDHTVKRNLNNLNMDVLFCGNQKVNSGQSDDLAEIQGPDGKTEKTV